MSPAGSGWEGGLSNRLVALSVSNSPDLGRLGLLKRSLDQTVSALATGLVFGVPGFASVAAGIVAGRIIGRRGARIVLLAALLIQGGLTAPMILLGAEPVWLWLLIPALFGGFFGHITAVVAATVTATSEVPDAHKGLATGLVTTSQRVAVTVGIPILGAVMAIRADLLSGIRLALAADVLFTLTAVILIRAGLSRQGPIGMPPGATA